MDHYGTVNSVRAILYFRFLPLLQMNIIAGSLVGGIYRLFLQRLRAVEAIERVSRANRFEYGKVRVAGCVGWALCASITGVLFGIDPNITFWIASGFALVLGLLLWLSRPESSNSASYRGAGRQSPPFAAYGGRAAAYAALLGLYRHVVVSPASTTCLTSSSPTFSKAFRQSAARYRSVWLRHHRRRVAQRADHVLRAGHR